MGSRFSAILVNVFSPQGISGWADFRKIFQKASISSFRVRTSLRATKEIVTFTNKILANTAPTTKLVTPLNRHGPKPTYLRSNTYSDMVNSIVTDTQALLSNGIKTIGVLCKTMAESKRLRKALLDAGPSTVSDRRPRLKKREPDFPRADLYGAWTGIRRRDYRWSAKVELPSVAPQR